MRKGEEFRTEATELRHRERGDVRGVFSVHSVVQGFDPSGRNSLCGLRVKRSRIRPPPSLS
jgi:hypothetical protein